MINITYTDNTGETHLGKDYSTEYPCGVYSANAAEEVVYITEIDINGQEATFVLETTYNFKDNYTYFARVTDTQNVEIEPLTRIYKVGHGAHQNVYGICETGKCKVPVASIEYLNNKFVVMDVEYSGIRSSNTYDYPEGLNSNNCVLLTYYRPSYIQYGTLDYIIRLKDDYIDINLPGTSNVKTTIRLILMRLDT